LTEFSAVWAHTPFIARSKATDQPAVAAELAQISSLPDFRTDSDHCFVMVVTLLECATSTSPVSRQRPSERRGLWKHGLDLDRCATDVCVFVCIRLSVGVAPRMTGGLVEPSLEELGVLELEHLDLAKTQGDPVGDNDQLSTPVLRVTPAGSVLPISIGKALVLRLVVVIVYFVYPSMVSPFEMSGLCTTVMREGRIGSNFNLQYIFASKVRCRI
jgi:hypothetical protein